MSVELCGVVLVTHTDGMRFEHVVGTPVVPLFPVYFGVSLLKRYNRKKGTLIIKGDLGSLVYK